MKALIADDEPIARQILREHLEDIAGVVVVGEAMSGADALEQVGRLRPDIVFLDLQMPGVDGFTVARSLKGSRLPLVIFVTAHDNRAVDAFEMGAVDYLLKPVRRERIEGALVKARRQMAAEAPPLVTVAQSGPRRIVGRLGGDYHMLDTSSVIAFQAEGETVYILTAAGRFLAEHPLRVLEEKLPSPPFRRIHRKTIINTDHIKRISPLSSKRWLLKMSTGLEVIVSKRMAGAIREATDW
jgi:two-component system, LytTR family, response regulator